MSAIQTHLIRYAHDADEAVERIDELLAEAAEPAVVRAGENEPREGEQFLGSMGL